MEQFIVAEITKNWNNGISTTPLISQQFENVINVNDQRGYKLKDWKINQVQTAESFVETIIAIFERKDEQDSR